MIEVGDMVKIREDQVNQKGLGHGIVTEIESDFYKYPMRRTNRKENRLKVHWLFYNTVSYEPASVLEIVSKYVKKDLP